MSVHKSKVEWAERCPVRDVLERMGDRWSMLVLLMLRDHTTMRFSVLKNTMTSKFRFKLKESSLY